MNELKLLLALVGELEKLRYQSKIKATSITKAALNNDISLAEKLKNEIEGGRQTYVSIRDCIIAYCKEANVLNPFIEGFQC